MKDRKFSIFFFSFIFAALVWLSVNLGNIFQTEIEIPIQIENIPSGKAIATPLPSAIHAKIQGTGWQILNIILSPNLYFKINFTALSAKDSLFTTKHLLEFSPILRELGILQTSPESFVIRFDEKISKRVPIVPSISAYYRNGFGIVGKMRTSPDSVTLIGAKSLLQKINEWKVKDITLEDVFTPIQLNVELSDTLSIQIQRTHNSALLSFDVQPLAEKKIENIPVEILQIPDNRNILLIPKTITIIVRSGVNIISQVSEKDFSAYIDYRSVLLDTSGFVQPLITGPDEIKIVQLLPEKLQYVIRK